MPRLALLTTLGVAACSAPSAPPVRPNPALEEVPLDSAAEQWDAYLALDNEDTGIWTVGAFPVFAQHGCPEIVGLDDLGRCHVLVSYSGKWTPLTRAGDGKWLGGLCHGEVDPRVVGAELYAGGQKGNIYQLSAYPHGALDCRLIAHLPGLEVHTLLAGDLDPRVSGNEILAFTRPGYLYRLSPTGPHGSFESVRLGQLSGRVRDALLLPARPGAPQEIVTASRAGRLESLTLTEEGARWRTIHEEAMGMGRITLRPQGPGEPTVLYCTLDDGRVLRLQRESKSEWTSETIFAGAQGLRGIAAGQFDSDPAVETVAVFGYGKQVQLLTRTGGTWSVETLFVDRDKGHWLSTAELDGRNGTDELIGSGYGARIFVLTRPPGYGLEQVLTDPALGSD